MEAEVTENPLGKLNERQTHFVKEFVKCYNATLAAKRAGYSAKTAYSIGHENLKKPEIAKAISQLCELVAMSPGEAISHFSDIARTRVNHYMKVVKVRKTPMVMKPLQDLIDDLQKEMQLEERFAEVADLNKVETREHRTAQRKRELQIIRYTLELEEFPNAYREVAGEPEWVDDIQLDLVALAQAEGEGRIQELKWNEHGPIVKLESASNALDKLLQVHGRYKQMPGDADPSKPKFVVARELPDGELLRAIDKLVHQIDVNPS